MLNVGNELLAAPYFPSISRQLTQEEKEEGCRWYFDNLEAGAIPDIIISNCTDALTIREIQDSRKLSSMLLTHTWKFICQSEVLNKVNNPYELESRFRSIYDDLYSYVTKFKAAWDTWKDSILEFTNHNDQIALQRHATLERILFADPLSSSNFQQCGVMLLIFGETLKSRYIYLDSADRPIARRILDQYSSEVLRLGSRIVDKTIENSLERDDGMLDVAIDTTVLLGRQEGFHPSNNELDSFMNEYHNTKDLRFRGLFLPFLPLRPYSVFPTTCKFMEKFKCLSVGSFFNSFNFGLRFIDQGLIVSAFAKLLFEMTNINWTIGKRFCLDYLCDSMSETEGYRPPDETARTYSLQSYLERVHIGYFRLADQLRCENHANVYYILHQAMELKKQPLQIRTECKPFGERFIGYLVRFLEVLVTLLNNPCTWVTEANTLTSITNEVRQYLVTLVERRRELRNPKREPLPSIGLGIFMRKGLLTTGHEDFDFDLFFTDIPICSVFSSTFYSS